MKHIKRHIKDRSLAMLRTHPILFINGPRQAGKSTFVQELSKKEFPAEYVSFDSMAQISAARNAPEIYLKERKGALIIDEVQLVPEIFRPLKQVVDAFRRQEGGKSNGRFLLTGSANIMALPKLSNPLVGRMGVLTLYPFSGAEILKGQGDFLHRIFIENFYEAKGNQNIIRVMKKATFPEISGETSESCAHWFDGYLTTILQRDVRALAEIEKLSSLPNLLRILAIRSGGLINDADIARDAGLVHVTSRNYRFLLRMLFLTFEVPPWYRNIGKRLVKASKGYMVDTLLLCHLLQYDLEGMDQKQPDLFGHVLENFVATELLKMVANDPTRLQMHHFRTSDNKEVDFVFEKPDGQMVGIEVKSRDYVNQSDFKGLKSLQSLTKEDFVCGVVLYRGKDVVPFGKNLWAIPFENLWL